MNCRIASRMEALVAAATLGETRLMNGERGEGPLDAASVLHGCAAVPEFEGYAVLGTLGSGAFSVVFRAWDEKLQRQVAIKVLRPRAPIDGAGKERFLEEARALARVHHPNVLTVHDVIEQAGTTAIVTEYIDGRTIEAIVRERGLYGAAEAAQLGSEVCKALAAVHAAGIVHRDVKPANILRADGGRIVLADFGLGVFLSPGTRLLDESMLAGTPLFMSPEQAKAGDLDPRSDLYALGVVLYSITTGRFPAEAPDMERLLENIKDGNMRRLRDVRPDLPDAFVAAVTKALAADRVHRFQSAGEMEQALLSAVTGGSDAQSAAATDEVSRPAAPRRRGFELALGLGRWKLRLGITIGLFALCFVLVWTTAGGRRGEVAEFAFQRVPEPPPSIVVSHDHPDPDLARGTGKGNLAVLRVTAKGMRSSASTTSRSATPPFGATAEIVLEPPPNTGATCGRGLEDSDAFAGTAFSLRYAAQRDLFVYVLADNEKEMPALLFPLRASIRRNPLPAGAGQALPGACSSGDERAAPRAGSWRLPAECERVRVLTIACLTPVGELEALAESHMDRSRSAGCVYPRLGLLELRAVIGRVGRLSPAPVNDLLASKETLRALTTRPGASANEAAEERGVCVLIATVDLSGGTQAPGDRRGAE